MYIQGQLVTVIDTVDNKEIEATVISEFNEKEFKVRFELDGRTWGYSFRTATGNRIGSKRFVADWKRFKVKK